MADGTLSTVGDWRCSGDNYYNRTFVILWHAIYTIELLVRYLESIAENPWFG
jgi:hypothetical protein